MTKNYFKKKDNTCQLPKKSTVDFILNYSKALEVISTKNGIVNLVMN